MRIGSRLYWPAISLLLYGLSTLALALVEESCEGSEACSSLADEIELFEDEQPLSLLQRKATQIQAHRPSSGVTIESPRVSAVDTALQPADEQPLSLLQQGATTNHVVKKPVTDAGEDLQQGSDNWPELDTKSQIYSIHTISTMVKERGQFAVLFVGCIILALLWAPTVLRKGKKEIPALPVQVRVDHFVTSSSKLLTAARDVPKTQSLAEAAYHTISPEAVVSTVELSTDASAVSGLIALKPMPAPGNMASASPPEMREVNASPIDPVFVLPLCETWYGVCVEPFSMCDGNFDILRIAGYPVLHGAVRHADGARLLEITCSGLPAKQGQILARVAIECPPPVAQDTNSTEVASVVPQAPHVLKVDGLDGKPYGYIKLAPDGSYTLTCGEDEVLSLASEDGHPLVLRSIGNKKEIAQASWFEQSDHFSGAGHLAVRINPNEDTLLVLACTLALTILGGGSNLPHSTRPAKKNAE